MLDCQHGCYQRPRSGVFHHSCFVDRLTELGWTAVNIRHRNLKYLTREFRWSTLLLDC